MKKKRTKRKATNPTGKTSPPYPKEFKLRVVRLYLEEGYQASLIAKEFKVSEYSIYRWGRLYRQYGERGLEPGIRKPVKNKQSKRVKNKIVAIRKENPSHGSRRISDILKRFFLIDDSVSNETSKEMSQRSNMNLAISVALLQEWIKISTDPDMIYRIPAIRNILNSYILFPVFEVYPVNMIPRLLERAERHKTYSCQCIYW